MPGQQSPTAKAAVISTNTTIRVRSDLVLIPVTVTDKSGKPVSGLEKEQFTLFEDDTQQEITHFAAEDAPASIAILFDASDSMTPKVRKAREAVGALLNSINPDSELSLIRFSTRAQVLVPLTSHLDEIRDAAYNIRIAGATALLDAVRLGMQQLAEARYTRKAIIIISDGEDNASHWTVNELKTSVREQDVVIYSIAIAESMGSYAELQQMMGAALLKDISSQSGGCMYPLTRLQDLPQIGYKIGSRLRNQYVLGYVPTRPAMDGTYRKVELRITRPKGFPKLQAAWRRGYLAPKE